MNGDSELIRRAQSGDMAAFSELVHRHDKAVLSLAARFVDSAEDAKDIYQEVLIRVFRGLGTFKFKSEFSTWIHRIAVNVCLTHKSRARTGRFTSLDADGDAPEGALGSAMQVHVDEHRPDIRAARSEAAEHIQNALLTLSPKQRIVFTLRHYDGRPLKEIAKALHCTEGTVKRYLYTATRRMRTRLQHLA
jgi:RNA polymerase sigma-70 factor (ECF subfamily)